jgi:ATP-dependent helicase Lhr and Lhr-like helicase
VPRLVGCDLPATVSKRAVEKLDELRQDFTWLQSGRTAVVRGSDGHVKWWTFGGLNANAALATWLRERTGSAIAPNNLSIKLGSGVLGTELEGLLRELRDVPAEALLPQVSDDDALDGLKFTACLPKELARQVLQMRMMDVPAVERVQAEPVGFVSES